MRRLWPYLLGIGLVLAACRSAVEMNVTVWLCVVDGDTLYRQRPDTSGVRCAAVDTVRT